MESWKIGKVLFFVRLFLSWATGSWVLGTSLVFRPITYVKNSFLNGFMFDKNDI